MRSNYTSYQELRVFITQLQTFTCNLHTWRFSDRHHDSLQHKYIKNTRVNEAQNTFPCSKASLTYQI